MFYLKCTKINILHWNWKYFTFHRLGLALVFYRIFPIWLEIDRTSFSTVKHLTQVWPWKVTIIFYWMQVVFRRCFLRKKSLVITDNVNWKKKNVKMVFVIVHFFVNLDLANLIDFIMCINFCIYLSCRCVFRQWFVDITF